MTETAIATAPAPAGTPMYNTLLGHYLRTIRSKHLQTIGYMADIIGLDPNQLSMIEWFQLPPPDSMFETLSQQYEFVGEDVGGIALCLHNQDKLKAERGTLPLRE